jgi:tetratricopeptide (TPR) repeat protein
VVLLLGVSGAAGLFGQAGRGIGRLKGSVKDVDGKFIAGAQVEIVWHSDQKIKRKTKTNKKGRYSFNALAGGNWQVFVKAEGYAEGQKMAAIQQVQDNPPVNIILRRPSQAVQKKKKLDSSTKLVEAGKLLFAEAKFDEALEKFQEFLGKAPEFYQTHLLIGNCYKEKSEFDKAMAEYKTALEKAPTDGTDKNVLAQVQSAIGDLYIRQNDLKTAQEYFKKSLELDPSNEILAYNVGEIFFSNNKTDDAITYFKLASSIKPTWGMPHLKMGYAYLNSADYKNAVACFNEFLKLDPNHAEAAGIKELVKSLKDM